MQYGFVLSVVVKITLILDLEFFLLQRREMRGTTKDGEVLGDKSRRIILILEIYKYELV
jgi:hypothetical protein